MKKLLIILLFSVLTSCKTTSQTQNPTTDTLIQLKEDSQIDLKSPNKKFTIELIQSEDDFITIILPIATLLLGIFIEKGLEAWKENKKFHKNIKRWKLELFALKDPLKNQIEHLKEFNSSQLKNKNLMPNLGLSTNLDCENFKLLDRTELFDYYKKIQNKNENDSLHNVNKINSNLKAIQYYYERIIEKWNEYKAGRSKHTNLLNNNLQQLLLEFNKLKLKNEPLIKSDPGKQKHFMNVHNIINAEIEPFKANGDFKIFEMEKSFFQPLIDEMNALSSHINVIQILEYANNCINQIKGIEREIDYVTTNYENYQTQLKTSQESLDNSIKSLQ